MLRVLPLLAFLIIAALCALPLLQGRDPAALPSALIGQAAPPANLPPDALRGGGPVLVNFFASWCVSCAAEQDELAAIAQKEGIPVYGVDYKDTREAAAAWLSAHGNPYKALGIDAVGRIAVDWGVSGVPETFIVDAGGIIRYRYAGPVTDEVYEKEIAPLLRELRK